MTEQEFEAWVEEEWEWRQEHGKEMFFPDGAHAAWAKAQDEKSKLLKSFKSGCIERDEIIDALKQKVDNLVKAGDVLRATILAQQTKADKLAEALECISEQSLWRNREDFNDKDIAYQALKEYQGKDTKT